MIGLVRCLSPIVVALNMIITDFDANCAGSLLMVYILFFNETNVCEWLVRFTTGYAVMMHAGTEFVYHPITSFSGIVND